MYIHMINLNLCFLQSDLFDIEWLGWRVPGSVCGFRFQFYCFGKIYTRLSQGRSKNTQRQSSQRLIRDSLRFLKT